MPETIEQLSWWLLNGCLLMLLYYIRMDLKRLTTNMEKNSRNNHKLYTFLMQINARCAIFHPERPALVPPEWED